MIAVHSGGPSQRKEQTTTMSSLAAGASAVHHLLGRILPRRRHTSPIWTPTSRPAMWSRFLSSSSPGVAAAASLQPPDVPRLADTARIELSPEEAEEFAPKFGRVIDWFGQLQVVDLENIEPSLRADTSVRANPREDLPETFENRDAIVAAVPSFDDPFIKVPKVLNKE